MIQRKTLMQLAYEQLKREILDGKLEAGRELSTQFFAEYLNISKTPCREALKRLEEEGLVELNQAYGVVIRGVSIQHLLNITQLRSAIDSYCAWYFGENSDSEPGRKLLAEAREVCARQMELLDSKPDDDREMSAQWYAIDQSFHRMICMFTGNQRILEQRDDIADYLRYTGIATANIPNRKRDSVNENIELLDAVERKDAPGACRLAKNHAEKIYRLMLKMQNA